jgi:hypothetical protein
MGNPFPGMNPFLEHPAFWADFHSTFIGCWRDSLRALLPKTYEARIGERVYLVEPPALARQIGPDVAVSQSVDAGAVTSASSSSAVVMDPVTLPLPIIDETREAYIEILQRPEMALVAVLELLSPYNKREPGFAEYLSKRNALFRQDVHVIELDLLLGGRRLPLGKSLPRGDYFALISRSDRRPYCNVYHWGLRDRLPTIPVPLRAPDADAATNLAEVFASVFQRGFYDESPDFGRRLPVSLPASEAAWVAEVMKSR